MSLRCRRSDIPCRGAVKTYEKPVDGPYWETAAAEWRVVLERDVSVRGYDFLSLGTTGPDKSGHWV